jgi:hypothetical protein
MKRIHLYFWDNSCCYGYIDINEKQLILESERIFHYFYISKQIVYT